MSAPAHPAPQSGPATDLAPVNLPPQNRGRAALGMTAAAALGRFALQACADCGAVQYPAREACHRCMSPALVWQPESGAAQLLSETTLYHSIDPYFQARLPWRLGLAQLDSGPTVMLHLLAAVAPAPTRLRVSVRLDSGGQAILIGFPDTQTMDINEDRLIHALSSDPRGRKILVTDGESAHGRALVRALAHAGAALIWSGHAAPLCSLPVADSGAALAQVNPVQLDVTDPGSIAVCAAAIGAEIDLLINTAEVHHQSPGTASRYGTGGAEAEMDVNYFGLLRLAQAFGPGLKRRSAANQGGAVAWVNLLSVYALSSLPAHGTFSASKAAALSLAQCLRAEMAHAGVRVVNVFPGPLDDAANRTSAGPKVSPEALALAIVKALRDGVEDVYPGDLAQEWLARWRDDPKIFERELARPGA